ncbi:GNAT family N-acetyltransferase [Actinomadura parmotrematis]|uniref:GNAT family N-acetyltransferase n=1 Tax=Actinomadura parmotrematis TaxID=2864039 RepID=A0ABS7G354_9ACTN|nr:GNAT family N-acetyltransferase [Actinomadura parmotrematis]MBW8486896.1 GNAT family N-acetyltransferase [Actinomadura parmotrematis]
MTAATGAAARTGLWTAEVLRDDAALAELRGPWEDLHGRCPAATPFQSHAWAASWWRHYGRPGRLRLAVVRRDGRLAGLAALHAVPRRGCLVLEPLAADLSDFSDVLLDPDHAGDAAGHLAAALLGEPGWHVLALPETGPDAAAHLLAERWPRRVRRLPSSTCLRLPAEDPAAFLARLPGRSAGKIRARLRRIEAAGPTATAVPPDEVPRAVEELLDLHVRQWEGRGINPEHLRGRFRRHLVDAVTALAHQGGAQVFRYTEDGALVAADLALVGGGFVGGYLFGCDPGLRGRVDVSLMLLQQELLLAHRLGRPAVNMLRGVEEYKMKWRPDPVRNERLLLARSPLAAPFVAAELGRAGLRAAKHRHRDRALAHPADPHADRANDRKDGAARPTARNRTRPKGNGAPE